MKTKHFINLTNGIEAIPSLPIEDYAFIRIQSTACEQKRWEHIILDIDNNFLMSLALGYQCIIYDYSNKRQTPRSIWQGLEFIKYSLYQTWFHETYLVDPDMKHYFRHVFNALPEIALNKLRYYRKFLMTDELHIETITAKTIHDGDYEYYADIMKFIVASKHLVNA